MVSSQGTEMEERRRPQQVLLAMLGTFVVDRWQEPIPSRVFIEVLGELGFAEMATRATLSRMVAKGLLARRKDGRVAVFALTPRAERILRDASKRVLSRSPFSHAEDEWTLFSYSLPESRREVRDQLRARLVWAGFGCLRDGLWIAPGIADLDDVLSDGDLADAVAESGGFLARPLPSTPMASIVARAWDLSAVRGQHDRFLRRWRQGPAPGPNPVTELTALVADWLQLLRVDPGLPAAYLPADWPAHESCDTYRREWGRLQTAFSAFEALARRR